MLKVYCGSDVSQVRSTALKEIAQITQGTNSVSTIDGQNFLPGMIIEAATAHSLFGGTEVYLIDTPSEAEDFLKEVLSSLEVLATSDNTFVVIEGALLAAAKKPYIKHATVFEEYKAPAAESFNMFAMADALANKDKKNLWMLLQEATHEGASAEEIIGMLWWQLKAIRIAGLTKTAQEAGMKAFPYSKAKRAHSKFTDIEIDTLSSDLLRVYHDGHAGRRDINLALEHWTLAI